MRQKTMTPLRAVRAKCLDCSSGSASEVRLCELEDCALWPFRMGHNPNRRKDGRLTDRGPEIAEKNAVETGKSIKEVARGAQE